MAASSARDASAAQAALVASFGGPLPSLARTIEQLSALGGTNTVLVSPKQRGNPVLRALRNVRWSFADVVPDYVLGGSGVVALFLSLRYHLLHPEYLAHRLRELQRAFKLRLVLCCVDCEDPAKPLGEVNKAALLQGATLVCAWSPEEAARYIETFKLYETKTAEGIQARAEADYGSRLAACLTTLRGVNKTDVATLGARLGSLAAVLTASKEELGACPGLGPTKVRRLHDAFHGPYRACRASCASFCVSHARVGRPCRAAAPHQRRDRRRGCSGDGGGGGGGDKCCGSGGGWCGAGAAGCGGGWCGWGRRGAHGERWGGQARRVGARRRRRRRRRRRVRR